MRQKDQKFDRIQLIAIKIFFFVADIQTFFKVFGEKSKIHLHFPRKLLKKRFVPVISEKGIF